MSSSIRARRTARVVRRAERHGEQLEHSTQECAPMAHHPCAAGTYMRARPSTVELAVTHDLAREIPSPKKKKELIE